MAGLAAQWLISGAIATIAVGIVLAALTTDPMATTPMAAALRRLQRLSRRVATVAAIILVVLAARATLTPAPLTEAQDFAATIHGATNCVDMTRHQDVIVELQCKVAGADDARFYLFRHETAESAWFEKFSIREPPGDCAQGAPARSTAPVGAPSEQVSGEISCFRTPQGASLMWTVDSADTGVLLTRNDGDIKALATTSQAVSVDGMQQVPTHGACTSDPVAWDEDGIGHDAWPSADLDLRLAPCTTILVSSGEFETPNHETCVGGSDAVCVMIWYSTKPGAVHLDSLAPGATWWSYTDSSPSDAIQEKSSLFNPKGWFGSANCSTSSGCRVARVWIVSDGFVSKTTITHP